MSIQNTPRSGRPTVEEFAIYAADDIAFVQGDDAIEALSKQGMYIEVQFAKHTDESVQGIRYAPGKWTVKEVLGHMIDDERIFGYRMLCIARGDTQPLAGFDENAYVAATAFEKLPLAQLMTQYRTVRASTLSMLAALELHEWDRRGTANGHSATVRGLAFHVAGHELRHLRSLEQRYFPLIRPVGSD